jgi:hypothetical protein
MKRALAIGMCLMMMLPIGLTTVGALSENSPSVDDGPSARASYRLVDMSLNVEYWGTDMYVGQTEDTNQFPQQQQEFYAYVITRYNHELYTGPNSLPYNGSYLSNVFFTIDSVVDVNYNPVAVSPIDWVTSTFENNSGSGSNMGSPNYGYYIYADDSSNYLAFKIKTANILPGVYHIKVKVDARVMTGYNGATYTFKSVTDYAFMRFSIRSIMYPHSDPDGKYSIYGLNEQDNVESIYSGATYEKVGIPNMYSSNYNVKKVTAQFNISNPRFQVVHGSCTGPDADQTFFWRVNIDRDTPPGMYDCGVKFSYTAVMNGKDVEIQEATSMQTITVAYTPLLNFPDNRGMTVPIAVVAKNAPNATIIVPVRNDGNVALKGVMVRMNLASASFFVNNNFYYDESYYSTQRFCDTVVDLGDMAVGESKEAAFPDVLIKNNLPPGKYLIKMDYSCLYYSDGSLKASGDYTSGSYPDYGLYDYGTIVKAVSYPEDPRYYYNIWPGVFVKVLDDDNGPQIEPVFGNPGYSYVPGQKNAPIWATFYNREKYSFTDVKYTIHTDMASPIKNLGLPDNSSMPTLSTTFRYGALYSNDNYNSFVFYADFRDSAMPGLQYIAIDFEGYNPYTQKVAKTFMLPVMINPANPDIRMTRSSVEVDSTNSIGTISVTVKNFGLGTARNVTAFFVPPSGLRCTDDIITVGDIPSDTVASYTIHLVPNSPSNSLWGSQSGTVYYGYTTVTGSLVRIYSGPSATISYQFQPKLPAFVITSVEAPDFTAKKTFNLKLTVTNTGGSAARDAVMMLINPNAQFSVKGSTLSSLGDIGPGQSSNVTYQLSTTGSLALQTTYSFVLDFSYKRIDGDARTFNEGEKPGFSLRTKDREVSALQQSKQTVENTGYTFDIGFMLIGLFLMIGLIMLAGAIKPRLSGPSSLPPPPPAYVPPVSPAYMPPAPQKGDDNMRNIPPPTP